MYLFWFTIYYIHKIIKALSMDVVGITNEKKAIITTQAILSMDYLMNSNVVKMCRNLLVNKCMENGIQICSKKKDCVDVQMSEGEITEVWIPFAKDLMDVIMCLGVAPIRFKVVDKKMIPYVPKAGSYHLQIVTSNEGLVTYTLHDMQSPANLEAAPNSIVLHGFGYDPRSDGSLCSIMKVLEPTMRFMSSLSDCAMRAEELRCNPPIIVEKKEVSSEVKEGVDFDFFLDSDALKSNISSQYQRDEKSIQRLKHQQRLFSNAIMGNDSEQKKKLEGAMNNLIPLPTSFKVGTTIEPSARNDYTQIMRSCAENICSLMGVPRSLLISDNVVRGDIEGSHESFKTACLVWKGIISKVLTLVYRHVFTEKEVARLANIAKKRKIKDISSMDDDITQVIVPVTPYISNSELKELYLLNIIDWMTYKRYVLRNCSLPIDLAKKNEKDPWSKEEKMIMLGSAPKQNENQNENQNSIKSTTKQPQKKTKTDKTDTKVKAAGSGQT